MWRMKKKMYIVQKVPKTPSTSSFMCTAVFFVVVVGVTQNSSLDAIFCWGHFYKQKLLIQWLLEGNDDIFH